MHRSPFLALFSMGWMPTGRTQRRARTTPDPVRLIARFPSGGPRRAIVGLPNSESTRPVISDR
jgi:hypothetical protein